MSQDEKRKRDSRLSTLTNALKRHQEERLEISAFQVGDVRAEKAVVVTDEATLVGDLLAPEIFVEGLIYGYVACRRLVVAPGGQIWGDVYVSALELAPTGKINGWVSTLDAGTVDLLRAKELGTGDLPGQDDWRLPDELLERVKKAGAEIEDDQRNSQRRSGIWRQLRSEAALALIARSEIESTLDQRLEEALAVSGVEEMDASTGQPALNEAAESLSETPGADAHEPVTGPPTQVDEDRQRSAEIAQLQAQLCQATSAAQKYYGELLWTRAELRAARGGDSGR